MIQHAEEQDDVEQTADAFRREIHHVEEDVLDAGSESPTSEFEPRLRGMATRVAPDGVIHRHDPVSTPPLGLE